MTFWAKSLRVFNYLWEHGTQSVRRIARKTGFSNSSVHRLQQAIARRGRRTYTLWPDHRQPMISADMGYPPAAEWLRRTLVPTLRRLPDAARDEAFFGVAAGRPGLTLVELIFVLWRMSHRTMIGRRTEQGAHRP